jgi:hypothetical protein
VPAPIKDLPPGRWTQDVKEHLDELVEKGTVQKYERPPDRDRRGQLQGVVRNGARDFKDDPRVEHVPADAQGIQK